MALWPDPHELLNALPTTNSMFDLHLPLLIISPLEYSKGAICIIANENQNKTLLVGPLHLYFYYKAGVIAG